MRLLFSFLLHKLIMAILSYCQPTFIAFEERSKQSEILTWTYNLLCALVILNSIFPYSDLILLSSHLYCDCDQNRMRFLTWTDKLLCALVILSNIFPYGDLILLSSHLYCDCNQNRVRFLTWTDKLLWALVILSNAYPTSQAHYGDLILLLSHLCCD